MGRRDELTDAACDYALEYGVIGLSLRPLAKAIGTSDRMLVYHFGSRDALVAAIIERSTHRSVALVEAMKPAQDVRSGVRALWRAHTRGQLDRCQRVYAQAAAEGLLGEPAAADPVSQANAAWMAAVSEYFVRCGAAPVRAVRVARFVDAAIMGLHLDSSLDRPADLTAIVDDVATAAAALASGEA